MPNSDDYDDDMPERELLTDEPTPAWMRTSGERDPGPYDFARERREALEADEPYQLVKIGGQLYDANDVPDRSDLLW
jgi:hypothetical protein